MQNSRGGSPPSPRVPPPPKTNRSSKKRHGRPRDRGRGYSLPRSKSRRSEVTLTLCVFHTTSHKWSTEPFRFDPNRTNDRELWMDIRTAFRTDLQKPWRRIFGFKKVKSIVPIAVCNCSRIIFCLSNHGPLNSTNAVHPEWRASPHRPKGLSRHQAVYARLPPPRSDQTRSSMGGLVRRVRHQRSETQRARVRGRAVGGQVGRRRCDHVGRHHRHLHCLGVERRKSTDGLYRDGICADVRCW